MGAEASTSINGVWARLEGQVVDGRFPLQRLLGSSDHSGVFLVSSAELAPSDVALKLVSLAQAHVESQLARWHTAASVSHPNLMRLLDVGRCNVGGLGNLYAVMEYADQDLAQLLQRRALTEEETREMLMPTLSALAFLHERKLVLGRLKPSNVLVVGDQLKLASDAIRSVGEVDDVKALSVYDPPEARDGRCSTASDVWALGVTLCEALTRRQPMGLLGGAGTVVLPPDLPPAFREIVAWCLKRQPQDRPDVAEIDAWLSGQPLRVASPELLPQAVHELLAAEGETAASASEALAAETLAPGSLASGVLASGTLASGVPAPGPLAPESYESGMLGPESPTPASTSTFDVELAAGMDSAAPLQGAPAASKPAPPVQTAASPPSSAPSSPLAAAPAAPTTVSATPKVSAAASKPAPAAPASAPSPAVAAPSVSNAPASSRPASVAPAAAPLAPTTAPAAPITPPSGATGARAASNASVTPGSAPATRTTVLPASAVPAANANASVAPKPVAHTTAPSPSVVAPAAAAASSARAASAAAQGASSASSAPKSPLVAPPTASSPPSAAPANTRSASATASAASAAPTVLRSAPGTPPSRGTAAASASTSALKYSSVAQRPAPVQAKPLSGAAQSPSSGAQAAVGVSKSKRIEPTSPAPVSRAHLDEDDSFVHPRRPLLPLALGAVVLIAVVWGGIRLFGGAPTSQPAVEVASASPDASMGGQSTASSGLPAQRAPGTAERSNVPANAQSATGAKLPANSRASLNGKLAGKPPLPAGAATAHTAGVHEVLPDVPPRARRTIRGNVKVSVRVIVEQDGSVFAALAEQRGPSRYFERLAIDAAKQWTFPPADSEAQRFMLVKFAFNREGTTAEAVTLN